MSLNLFELADSARKVIETSTTVIPLVAEPRFHQKIRSGIANLFKPEKQTKKVNGPNTTHSLTSPSSPSPSSPSPSSPSPSSPSTSATSTTISTVSLPEEENRHREIDVSAFDDPCMICLLYTSPSPRDS